MPTTSKLYIAISIVSFLVIGAPLVMQWKKAQEFPTFALVGMFLIVVGYFFSLSLGVSYSLVAAGVLLVVFGAIRKHLS
jgi:hypothetical protein